MFVDLCWVLIKVLFLLFFSLSLAVCIVFWEAGPLITLCVQCIFFSAFSNYKIQLLNRSRKNPLHIHGIFQKWKTSFSENPMVLHWIKMNFPLKSVSIRDFREKKRLAWYPSSYRFILHFNVFFLQTPTGHPSSFSRKIIINAKLLKHISIYSGNLYALYYVASTRTTVCFHFVRTKIVCAKSNIKAHSFVKCGLFSTSTTITSTAAATAAAATIQPKLCALHHSMGDDCGSA